jgi:hypothetical protein
MNDERVDTHAVRAPGDVIRILHADVEEDDGVVVGEIKRLSAVRENVSGLKILVSVGLGDGKGGYGLDAAVNDAVIKGASKAGERERTSWDEGVRVSDNRGRKGRDMNNVERATVHVWEEESLRIQECKRVISLVREFGGLCLQINRWAYNKLDERDTP